jgi:hypothetical protein
MSQPPEERTPDGREEAQTIELGEPRRADTEGPDESLEELPRPNLDRRQDRISTERKPAGPPLEAGPESLDEGRARENTEPPTDPS